MEQNVLIGIGVTLVAFERLASFIKSLKTNTSDKQLVDAINQLVAKIDVLISMHKIEHTTK